MGAGGQSEYRPAYSPRSGSVAAKRGEGKKSHPQPAVRTAEQPGQALNIDLCFVPEQHAAQDKLPAVSGSSGRLVVARAQSDRDEPQWPGQIFAEAGLDYEEAMRRYAAATRARLVHQSTERPVTDSAVSRWRLRSEARAERYRVREQRQREDAAWKAAKAERRGARQRYQALPRPERAQHSAAWHRADQAWRELRAQRRALLEARQQEDSAWHQRIRQRAADTAGAGMARVWLAILVVADNCTRQCLGLAIFTAGAKLTGEELVRALREILPEQLQFVISDQGTHFRAKVFAELAQQCGFVHVPVYRHRPESNGVAERLVLTLKNWLQSKSWDGSDELTPLLATFQLEYNARPHQGLAIPGLSPNEFAKRIWLM